MKDADEADIEEEPLPQLYMLMCLQKNMLFGAFQDAVGFPQLGLAFAQAPTLKAASTYVDMDLDASHNGIWDLIRYRTMVVLDLPADDLVRDAAVTAAKLGAFMEMLAQDCQRDRVKILGGSMRSIVTIKQDPEDPMEFKHVIGIAWLEINEDDIPEED